MLDPARPTTPMTKQQVPLRASVAVQNRGPLSEGFVYFPWSTWRTYPYALVPPQNVLHPPYPYTLNPKMSGTPDRKMFSPPPETKPPNPDIIDTPKGHLHIVTMFGILEVGGRGVSQSGRALLLMEDIEHQSIYPQPPVGVQQCWTLRPQTLVQDFLWEQQQHIFVLTWKYGPLP